MPETKTKRAPRTKKASAGHSPIPHAMGSVCGHSGCDVNCKVRYSGPTSHPRDHRLYEIAHGVKHIWTAAIVAGLAVVLTGSIAYTAVQAETAPKVRNLNEAVAAIYRKLDTIDQNVKQIKEKLNQGMPRPNSTSTSLMMQNGQKQGGDSQKPPELSAEAKACVDACRTTWKTCQESAGDSKESKEACTKTAYECAKKCLPSGAPMPPLTTAPPQTGSSDQPIQ